MSHTFSVTITDEEYSAFEKVVIDPNAWAVDAINNKVRKAVLRVTEETLKDAENNLSPEDVATLTTHIADNGLVLAHWSKWPYGVLKKIAGASLIPTRVEQEAATGP